MAKNDNEMLIARIKGVGAQAATPETDANPANPNSALIDEVSLMVLEALKGFLQGHGRLIVEPTPNGCMSIRYQA